MDSLGKLPGLIQSFNWHEPSWSLFIVLFWVVAAVIYALASGKGRILSILVAVYMAKLLVIEAPFLKELVNERFSIATDSLQYLATFGVIFGILFLFLSKYGFRATAEGRGGMTLLFGIPFSFLQLGLLINIVLGFLPPTVTENFQPLIKFIFLDPGANFVWLVLPVVFLLIFGRFVSHRHE